MPKTILQKILPQREGRPCVREEQWQGRLTSVILLLSVISWIFTIVSFSRCTFLKIGHDATGLFRVAYYKDDSLVGCIAFHEKDFDGTFRVARFFAVLTGFASTVSLVSVVVMIGFVTVHDYRRLLLLICKVCFPLAFVCNMLSFVVFASEHCKTDSNECVPGGASITAIFNMPILLACAVVVFVIPTPRKCLFTPNWGVVEGNKRVKFQDVGKEHPKADRMASPRADKPPVSADPNMGLPLDENKTPVSRMVCSLDVTCESECDNSASERTEYDPEQ